MADRKVPYGVFNFLVKIPDVVQDERSLIAGFSDASGLGTEFTVAEYRTGNEGVNRTRKVPGLFKASDVTLRRGLINNTALWEWIELLKRSGPEGQGKKDVVIELMDEEGNARYEWTLKGAFPLRWTGPTLAAKASGDVAMEELVLSVEEISQNATLS